MAAGAAENGVADDLFQKKTTNFMIITPVQTTFRNMEGSPALAARIQEEADKLERCYDRITSCRVVVEAPHRHHRYGEPFHVRIELGVPGKQLVVAHEPAAKHEDQREWHKHLEVQGPHKDVSVAIRDAFKAIRRQLRDYVRCLRHDVKTHEPIAHAKVCKLFPKEGYGFIETPNGRQIYFHKNSVPNLAFERLEIGDEVIFSEEAGNKGPQATCIRAAGKYQPIAVPEE